MISQTLDFQNVINESIEKALKSRGIANVLVAGKTGVGKSTLINAVFQGRMTETGQGQPVTQHTRRISKEGVPVSIYDTKGLEIKDYRPILDELLGLIKSQNSQRDPHAHIHVAWLCIAEGSRRVEEAELSLVKELSERIPVVVVITTAVADGGFRKVVQDIMPDARNVIRVNSIPQNMDGGIVIPQHGLQDLVDVTMEVIPDGQKKAFAAAQRVAMQHKVNQAHKVVAASAASAGGIAAAPIPFSDAIAIVPIQIAMLAGISVAFGLDVTKAFLGTVVSSTFTSIAGTLSGKAVVGALLKFVPGLGSAAGGAISATVAVALTAAFGEAYVAVLQKLLSEDADRELSGQEVADALKKYLKGD